jgi:hypothetical protein
MPPLAAAKRRVGLALGSSATTSESRQTTLCAYLPAALLIGLLSNVILGWWWADPAVALVIGAVSLREARDARRGDSCGCCWLKTRFGCSTRLIDRSARAPAKRESAFAGDDRFMLGTSPDRTIGMATK